LPEHSRRRSRQGQLRFRIEVRERHGANWRLSVLLQRVELQVESTALQYSIVAGCKAHYRGIGTVNGAPGYGFALTATDGQVNGGDRYDKFRIKIWYGAPGTLV
jgi:hypothetical protein